MLSRGSGNKPRPTWRGVVQQIHLWVGVTLGLPFIALGLSGTILVFEPELDTLFQPRQHKAVSPGEAQSITAILAAAREAAPPGSTPFFFIAPPTPDAAATVRLALPGRAAPGPGGLQILVDPVSLAILDNGESGAGLMRSIALLHTNLMIRDRSGRDAVGWLGVAMLGLGVTGLVLWWPRGGRWRQAFLIRRDATGIRLHRELHGTAGIWLWLVFITVSFSGVYLAFPQTVGAGISAVLPARDLRQSVAALRVMPIEGAVPLDADGAVALARAEIPDGGLRLVVLPMRPEQPVRVALARWGDAAGAPPVAVFVDPWVRRVLAVQDPNLYSAGESMLAWLRPVHTGAGLGWVWRILVALSGLLPALFVITGCTMWLMKRRARRRTNSRQLIVAEISTIESSQP